MEHKTKYAPTSEDIDKVVAVASPNTQDYLLSIRDTIGRMGEINGLAWDDVNFKQRFTPYIRKKGGNLTPRKVPMTNRLYEILNSIGPAERDTISVFEQSVKSLTQIITQKKRG